jgi:predicted nucleotidyltransferase
MEYTDAKQFWSATMVRPAIKSSSQEIAVFCRNHGIERLSFFGSILRNDFNADSDVDVLVRFKPGQTVGLKIVAMEEELADLLGLGRKVDMVSEKYLNPRLRERIIASAQVQYDEG